MACARVDLVGVGLNATDTVIALDRFPERGAKLEYREAPRVLPGGQVATAVVACQGWGLRTRYVGMLGDDSAGELHRREFTRVGVESRLVTVAGAASAQSLILVDAGGERTVLRHKDDRMRMQPGQMERGWVTEAGVLLVDGYDTEAATVAAGWAREAGVPVVADLDEVYPGVEALLGWVDFAIVSRDLPGRLMGETDLRRALVGMQRKYGCRLAAATLGEGGVVGWDGEGWHEAAAFRVNAVDTTGAGDVFHAGFCYGLVRGWGMAEQLDFACAAAALNCGAVGARGGVGALEGVETMVRTGIRYGGGGAAVE